MSHADIQKIFDEYVFGFIFSDIQREINLARSGQGGGNLIAALGLLCYTEFMGSFVTGRRGQGTSKSNFNAFFNAMGPNYANFNKPKGQVNVYDIYRCGMAHEYLVKKDCVVYMTKKPTLSGVGKLPDGRYYVTVEQYFEDFQAACYQLYGKLMAQPSPSVPA